MMAQACSAFAVSLCLVATVAAQDSGGLAGKSLAEALSALQAAGVKLVFSSDLVLPEMRVDSPPKSAGGEALLRELLQPHGLDAKKGPRDTWFVVAGKPARPKGVLKPAAPQSRPPAGTLKGRVVDAETGDPISDVQVRLERTARSLVTDSDGRFEFGDVAEGTETLTVSMVGYALARRQVLVGGTEQGELVVPLARGTGAYTDHVIVTGGDEMRGAVSGTTRMLESRQIQDLGTVLADDPLRAVQALPGVAWNDDFRAELSVRGNGPDHIGLSIDDVPTPWLVHSVVGLGDDTGSIALVNGDIVDRMSLSPGVRSARLGDRTGAWLDTTIREGSRDAFGVRGSLSAASAAVVVEGPLGRGKRGSWLASARQSYLDWLLDRVTNDADETSIFGFTDAQGKIVFDLTPRHQLQFTLVGGRSRFEEEDASPGPNAIGLGLARTGLATVGLRSTISQTLLITQRVWATAQRFRNTGRFNQELGRGSGRELGYRADASWNPASAMVVQFGGDVAARRESLVLRHFSIASRGAPLTTSYEDVAEASGVTGSGYAQVRWSAPGGFSVSPGVKVSRASAIDDTYASPWFETQWLGGPSLRLRAAAGLYHQLPDVDQLAGLGGNPNLQTERARYVEGGVGQDLGRWRWDVTVFDRRDLGYLRQTGAEPRRVGTVFLTGNPFGQWQNALDGRAHGVEASLGHDSGRWGGWLAYAYGESRYTDSVTREEFWSDYDQRHAWNAYGYYQLSARMRATGKIRFGSNFPIPAYVGPGGLELVVSSTRNQTRLPPYARVDLNISRAFFWSRHRLTLFVEVMNVTNHANYRATEGTIQFPRGDAFGFAEKLFPFLPVAGMMIEF